MDKQCLQHVLHIFLEISHYKKPIRSSQAFRYSSFTTHPSQLFQTRSTLIGIPLRQIQTTPLSLSSLSSQNFTNTFILNALLTSFNAMENNETKVSNLFKVQASSIFPKKLLTQTILIEKPKFNEKTKVLSFPPCQVFISSPHQAPSFLPLKYHTSPNKKILRNNVPPPAPDLGASIP